MEILTALGVCFTAGGVDIDETPRPGERPRELVARLAEEKARAALTDRPGPVLGADTVVVCERRIFGKPQSQQQALDMLARLSGRSHQVMTAIALIHDERLWSDLSTTRVHFRDIRPDEALGYWQSGEPAGKAGAYAIQGYGGVFVEAISGSYSGVVGLPVFETAELLSKAGLTIRPCDRSKDIETA